MLVLTQPLDFRARSLMPWALAYLLSFALFWSAAPGLLGLAPPPDNLEQLDWARHPALGYAKHPPLPTLILWLFEQVAPAGIPLTYALGGLQVLLTTTLAWLTARATLDGTRAALGAALITCISYYTLRLHYYNHNTALLCATAASMLCVWQAVRSGRWSWWVALGLCWAAGLMCKYQMALAILCNLAFAVRTARAGAVRPTLGLRAEPARGWLGMHAQAARPWAGLCLSAAVAAVACLPHLLWLVRHHFPSFAYAGAQLDAALPPVGRLDSLLRFSASQALRLLPAAVVLMAWRVMASRLDAAERSRPAHEHAATTAAAAREFWTIHAWGPFVAMAAMTLLGGVDLEMHWGTAYLWAMPPWYLSRADGERTSQVPIRDAFAVLAVAQALLMTGKVLFPDA